MPKFPGLSGNDLIRALQKFGFVVVRQSGSHIVLKNEGRTCVVPNHKELKVGTVCFGRRAWRQRISQKFSD
jgi:predicted RNA binding protein YcfA (HicA-like mRNA interferase family)